MREIADNLRADAPWNQSGEWVRITDIYLSNEGICIDVTIDGADYATITEPLSSDVYVDALDDKYDQWELKEVRWNNGVVELIGVSGDGILFSYHLSESHYQDYAERNIT